MEIERDSPDFENEVAKLVAGLTKEQTECTGIKKESCTGIDSANLEKSHFTQPEQIVCPRCGSKDIWKYGVRGGVQYYFCEKCKRKFTAKEAPFHMQSPAEQIGAALNMFYDGMSVADIARHLNVTFNNPVNASTVYRWVIRYTKEAIDLLTPLKPSVCDIWVVDETAVKVAGRNWWYWDILCDKTRFLIATHLSATRTIRDASTVIRSAWQRTDKAPKFIISDSLAAYPDGIERVFGSHSKHIKSWGMTEEINNNIIERFHGSIKERTKVMRGLKSAETGKLILDGWGIHYDFFRPHMTFNGKTPAEVAGIKAPYQNWTELVKGLNNQVCVISKGRQSYVCRVANKG